MNMLKKDFTTVEEGLKTLEQGVSLRNRMCGALYYNILNDDCIEIALKLATMGADRERVSLLLNS